MKSKWKFLATGLCLAYPLSAATVNFPAGTFDHGTTALWSSQTTGTATVSTPTSGGNTVGRIAVTGSGTGTMSTFVPDAFVAQSLYVITVDVKTTSLAGASTQLGIVATDGNGQMLGQLSQAQILNALGITAGTVSTLTGNLSALSGKLDLTTDLQSLLGLLSSDPAPLGAIQQLVHSLVGANSSTLSATVNLLQSVLGGTTDPATLTSLQLSQLLGIAQSDPIVANLRAVLASITGNDGVLDSLASLLGDLAGTTSDTNLVDNLLTTLVGQPGQLGTVSNILTYALGDSGLLGSLTDGLTQSLLGVANGATGVFQPVTLMFTTGGTPPPGAIGIQLSSGASLAIGQTVDFDNVTVQRFPLPVRVVTPAATGGGSTSASDSHSVSLTVKGRKILRNFNGAKVIHGTAAALGGTGRIVHVNYRLLGPGVSPRVRNAKGTHSWKIVLPQTGANLRVVIWAVDEGGHASAKTRVYLFPNG